MVRTSETKSRKIDPKDESEDEESEERRKRWTQRIEERTDDWALKSRLLDSLEVAHCAPVWVLSSEDLEAVKDQFLDGDLTPAQFLDELQSLPCNQCEFAALCKGCRCFE